MGASTPFDTTLGRSLAVRAEDKDYTPWHRLLVDAYNESCGTFAPFAPLYDINRHRTKERVPLLTYLLVRQTDNKHARDLPPAADVIGQPLFE